MKASYNLTYPYPTRGIDKPEPEAHGPQGSPECIAMKTLFGQNTVNVACKKKIHLSFAMATNQIQQFRFNHNGC